MQKMSSTFPVFREFLFFLRNYANILNTFDSIALMVLLKDGCWGRQISSNDVQFPNKIWLLSFQNVIAWNLLILKIVFVGTQIVIFKKLFAIY